MQDFGAQQVARQPPCKSAQVIFPVVTIFDVVQQAPRFLELLVPEGAKALTATCTQLRQDFRSSVTTIQMTNHQDTAMLYAKNWPSLVMVVISTTITPDEHQFGDHVNSHLSDTTVTLDEHQFGDHAESTLSDRGWSTVVRLQFEQARDDPTNWRSACRQSEALIVKASHQSSPDMDTKAHGSALAHFATDGNPRRNLWRCVRTQTQYAWTLSSICTWANGHVWSASFAKVSMAWNFLSAGSRVISHPTCNLI